MRHAADGARWIFFATLVASLPLVAAAEQKYLFNGKDLSGWSGNKELWSVEDGAIVGKTRGLTYNTFLIADGDYGDFELRFKARLMANNSGVQFRSRIIDKGKFVLAGYQADIANGYWGLLYEEKGRGMLDFKKDVRELVKLGDWADYIIRAEGPNITITCNDVETVRYVEMDAARGAKTGKIGLQLHAGIPMTVQFKDIILIEK